MDRRTYMCRLANSALLLLVLLSCSRSYHSQGDYFSTPDERTMFRMRTLRANIEGFATKHGRLPASLDEVLRPSTRPGEYSFRHDGWGRLIVYSMTGATFELVSSGPDGVEGTVDDLKLQGTSSGAPRQ